VTDDSRNFATSALIAAGLLMTALCGTCTAYFIGGPLWALARGDIAGAYLWPVVVVGALTVGGIPTLIGALILRSGLKRRRARPPPSAPPPG
jgi:hypothetical protein